MDDSPGERNRRGDVDTAVLDIDGTLVDTNYQHALAWYRAFRTHDIALPLWRIHRHIGMGGDQLVPALAGDEVERRHGDDLRDAQTGFFDELIDEVLPFAAAEDLLRELSGRGLTVVLASSGKEGHTERFLDLVHGRRYTQSWTTAKDAGTSKPAPDLVQVAMERAGSSAAVMIGDSTWDVEAAARAGIPAIAVRTGGFGRDELTEAGAVLVVESLEELIERLDETPFG